MLKLLAFDLFGTIFDMKDVPRPDLLRYRYQIDRNLEWEYEPFNLPESWEHLPVHVDAKEGMDWLRSRFTCVTFSNAPAKLQLRMLKNAGIQFDAITPLEMFKACKPALRVYPNLMHLWNYPAGEIGMVTANESFGDLEGATRSGMTGLLIRSPQVPTLLDLFEKLKRDV